MADLVGEAAAKSDAKLCVVVRKHFLEIVIRTLTGILKKKKRFRP